MNATFEIDESSKRALESTMQRYAATVDHDGPYVVNRVLQNIAGWAAHETIMADRAKVAAELGATYRTRNIRTGEPLKRKQTIVTATTLAKARYAATCRRVGKPIPPEPEFSRKVRQMVKSILASIAFMKAGWLPAYTKLKRAQAAAAMSEAAAFGGRARAGYGGSIAAHRVSDGIEGEIYNTSVNPKSPTSWTEGLGKWGGPALNRAIDLVRRDMDQFVATMHDKAAKAFNG
ncbi:MAG: hypothetical protein ABSA97_07310 [Verrucomicrobiia bacterium]